MGFGQVKIEDVEVVQTLGKNVSDCATAMEGLSYEPSLEAATNGNLESSVADACVGKDGQIESAVEKLCGNLRQYDQLCQDSATTYDATDGASADRARAAGRGLGQNVAS